MTDSKPGTALPQPLSQTVPDRLWLHDLGGGDITWCAERDPDGEQIDAVEYVRVEINAALLEALEGIKWKSADRDNMEFSARITTWQLGAIRAAIRLARGEG